MDFHASRAAHKIICSGGYGPSLAALKGSSGGYACLPKDPSARSKIPPAGSRRFRISAAAWGDVPWFGVALVVLRI
jgi:hypothetical protein